MNTSQNPSEPITLLVDALSLSDSAKFRGIGTYTRELLRALGQRDDVDVRALATRDAHLPANVERVTVIRVAPGRWARQEHEALISFDVARADARRRADVVHSPSPSAPRWSRAARVQTIHDVPDPHGEGHLETLTRSVARASQVICVSADTAAAATAVFDLDASRVTLARPGYASAFGPGPSSGQDPFLLFVGEYDPRKRHDLAIDIHNRLVGEGHRVRLRFIGRVAPWFAANWSEIVARSAHPDLVDICGYVPVETLADAYRSAVAVLVTSDHEGFGLPALEAMACGAPVIAFRGGATSEVVAEGGRLVDAGDVAAFVAEVRRVLTDPVYRSRLSAAALNRAAAFSWQRCAEEHVRAYRAAVVKRR